MALRNVLMLRVYMNPNIKSRPHVQNVACGHMTTRF